MNISQERFRVVGQKLPSGGSPQQLSDEIITQFSDTDSGDGVAHMQSRGIYGTLSCCGAIKTGIITGQPRFCLLDVTTGPQSHPASAEDRALRGRNLSAA